MPICSRLLLPRATLSARVPSVSQAWCVSVYSSQHMHRVRRATQSKRHFRRGIQHCHIALADTICMVKHDERQRIGTQTCRRVRVKCVPCFSLLCTALLVLLSLPDRNAWGARKCPLLRGFSLNCLGHSRAIQCLAAFRAERCAAGMKLSVAKLSLMTYATSTNEDGSQGRIISAVPIQTTSIHVRSQIS